MIEGELQKQAEQIRDRKKQQESSKNAQAKLEVTKTLV